VIGRPVKLEMAVRSIHGVLRLISRWIDECKRLAAHAILLPEGNRRAVRSIAVQHTAVLLYLKSGIITPVHNSHKGPLFALSGVIFMQRFVAELSVAIEQAAFERSWHRDESLNGKHPTVEFTFEHRRVLAVINSDASERWVSTSFYRSFTAAVRRIDRSCNIRWL